MRRNQNGFKFMGFLALADTLFAVSAGLLLLNPVSLKPETESLPASQPKPNSHVQQLQAILVEMNSVEQRLDRLETHGRAIQKQAAEVLKNE